MTRNRQRGAVTGHRLAPHAASHLLRSLLCLAMCLGAAGGAYAAEATPGTTLHTFDFTGQRSLSAYEWLAHQAFRLEKHADDRARIELYHADDALHLKVKKPAFGLIVHEQDITGARHVRLHWGVSDYPEGASYEHGVDNEAIMVYVFFGHERLPSGEIFVPDSPYFIGFYLCQPGTDQAEQPYVGHHYKKTGRYVCVDHPPEGETAVTTIDLASEFARSFGLEAVPTVSGISIEVDTTDAKNDGKAAAFLQRIEFLE